MSESEVRFGVLGCADIAWRRMLPALVAGDGMRVTAIASRSGERAARFAGRFGGDPVVGYEKLLARPDVDAVYLPLPAVLHAEWIERALLAGKHVLAEKPMTAGYAEAERVAAVAREQGLVLFENFMFLHHSQHAEVLRLAGSGAVGEIRGMSAAFTIPPKPRDDIRYRPDVGGGALLDVGVYPIRAAALLLGPQLSVIGATVRRDERRGVVLSGSALLSTPDGVTATLDFGMEHSYRTEYALYGSAGVLTLDRVFTPGPAHQPCVRIRRQDHEERFTLAPDDQFANVARLFAGAVRRHLAGGGAGLRTELDASVRNAALVDRVAGAARCFPC
jgi:NDP-hexose-3-ketoreductase